MPELCNGIEKPDKGRHLSYLVHETRRQFSWLG